MTGMGSGSNIGLSNELVGISRTGWNFRQMPGAECCEKFRKGLCFRCDEAMLLAL